MCAARFAKANDPDLFYYRSELGLRGGPLDGLKLPGFGWVEAIAVRTPTGLHWYLYVGTPPEAKEGHEGLLLHHHDDSPERAVTASDGEELTQHCCELHRASINDKIGELRVSINYLGERHPRRRQVHLAVRYRSQPHAAATATAPVLTGEEYQ